jgi:hypothetical protein
MPVVRRPKKAQKELVARLSVMGSMRRRQSIESPSLANWRSQDRAKWIVSKEKVLMPRLAAFGMRSLSRT